MRISPLGFSRTTYRFVGGVCLLVLCIAVATAQAQFSGGPSVKAPAVPRSEPQEKSESDDNKIGNNSKDKESDGSKSNATAKKDATKQESDAESGAKKPKPTEVAAEEEEEGWLSREELRARVNNTLPPPKDCRALHPNNRIWIERNDQVVIADGYIAQQAAQLEMFACPAGTKEHESIVAVFSRSQLVHAGLLAIGAKPGSPATFEPFQPAKGATIRIYALWYDKQGQRQATIAQKWVRNSRTKENLKSDWVFAGSRQYKDEYSNEVQYMADSGELVCVANFGTSTLDLVVESEQANANLVFDAFTERIPKRNTPVRLVFHLSPDNPFASNQDNEKETPAFLSDPVPGFISKYLEEKKP